MKFRPTWYADAAGNVYTARQTDQAGRHSPHNRTYRGQPVECVGAWWAVQISFRPFRKAVARAAAKAASRA